MRFMTLQLKNDGEVETIEISKRFAGNEVILQVA